MGHCGLAPFTTLDIMMVNVRIISENNISENIIKSYFLFSHSHYTSFVFVFNVA